MTLSLEEDIEVGVCRFSVDRRGFVGVYEQGGSRAMLLGGGGGGGGVPELLGGVRARRREAPSSKCDRGKRLPRELRQGSGAQK